MKAKLFLQSLFLVATFVSAFGQGEVILQDHKPLLGEIHYGNRVGGVQAQEGKSIQVFAFEEKDVLKSIQVFLGERNIVSGFQLEVIKEDGIEISTFDNVSGTPQEKYIVPKDRKLVGISGASGWYIDSLAFVFDNGSTTPKYGGEGGDLNFKLVLNKKQTGEYLGRLIGFWGSHTSVLETIGLIFWPIE